MDRLFLDPVGLDWRLGCGAGAWHAIPSSPKPLNAEAEPKGTLPFPSQEPRATRGQTSFRRGARSIRSLFQLDCSCVAQIRDPMYRATARLSSWSPPRPMFHRTATGALSVHIRINSDAAKTRAAFADSRFLSRHFLHGSDARAGQALFAARAFSSWATSQDAFPNQRARASSSISCAA